MFIRKTYCIPEQTRPGFDERGKPIRERIPNHPTRLARATDANTWLEEVPDVVMTGHWVRRIDGGWVCEQTFTVSGL